MNTVLVPRLALLLTSASLALAGLARAGGPPSAEPAAPLQGWIFDEGTGPITHDAFSARNATLEGFGPGLWPTPGPFAYPSDYCLGFDGLDNRVVSNPGGLISGRASSSVSAWFKFSTAPAPRQYVLYSERDGCEFNVFWLGVEMRPGLPSGITFGIFDATGPTCGLGSWHTLTHPFLPLDGAWHHVVATLEPVAGMKLYVDGAPVGALPGVLPYAGAGADYSTIGHAHTPSTPTYWSGSIDEVGLFDRALTPPEVTWLHGHSLRDIPVPDHTALCFGDGSGTACPCGNESAVGWDGGCKHSGNQGAKLVASGSARLSFDTLTLTAVEMTPYTSCLFFQGTTATNGGAGTTFGDGLRCAGGSVLRLSISSATDHYDYYPHATDDPVSVKGALPPAGGERYYQVWYRNAPDYCTSSTFNLSNAVRVAWGV